jgi:predicted tellurium resistance membrane protein TerC
LILKLVDRFPSIIVIGAGVLGWTAAKMISSEPLILRTAVEPAPMEVASALARV